MDDDQAGSPSTSATPDRREALKARHRRAIVDAAKALVTEMGDTSFTVDQLAERADVSRRTVFNHFATMDDIVLEVFGEMIETILDSIDATLASQETGRPGATPVFDRLAEAFRATDLVTPIVELTRIFAGEDPSCAPQRVVSPRRAVLFERAMHDLGARISATALRHHPRADPFEVDVMCSALVSGALAVHRHWHEATGGVDTPRSRGLWDELLDRMVDVTRNGFGSLSRDDSTS